MATMDADGSGEVDFEEFFDWFVENKDKKGGLFGGLKTLSGPGLFVGAGKAECAYVTEGATVAGVTPHTCILQWRVGGQSASPPAEFHVEQSGGMLGSWNDAGTFDLASVSECERGEGWHQCEVGGLAAGKRYQFRIRVRGEEGWGGYSKGFTGYTEEQSAEDAAAEAKQPLLALLLAATEDNETPIPPETMDSILRAVTDHPLLTEEAIGAICKSTSYLPVPVIARPIPDGLLVTADERLWVDSTTVKHKILVTVSKMCAVGPAGFHNATRSNEPFLVELKKLTQYVATTPHPTHGDKPQFMIRQMASNLVNQLAAERVEISLSGVKNIFGKKAAKGPGGEPPTPTPPVDSGEGHGAEYLSIQWTLLPAGCEPPAETEVQYGFRLKGSWKSAMRLDGSVTSCRIGGLKPATGYVVRIRCKGRHGGGWSSWAKSAPMATLEEQAELGTPLAEDAEAGMDAMYEALYIATEEGEAMPDAATLQEVVNVISAHGTLSSECIEFLVESFSNKSSTVLLKTHKVLGALLQAGGANPAGGAAQFITTAKRSEKLMSSLFALTKYTCEPHPTHGDKPQLMVQQVSDRLLTQLGAQAGPQEESKLSKGFGGLKNKAKAAADKALAGKRQHICIASLAWIVLKLTKLTPHWTGCSG